MRKEYPLNVIRFQAWGAIDIESMPRLQRRAHLNHIKAEVQALGLVLTVGGQPPEHAFYSLRDTTTLLSLTPEADKYMKPNEQVLYHPQVHSERGAGALTRICRWLVDNKDPDNKKDPEHETLAR
jgi:hypothetical protein